VADNIEEPLCEDEAIEKDVLRYFPAYCVCQIYKNEEVVKGGNVFC